MPYVTVSILEKATVRFQPPFISSHQVSFSFLVFLFPILPLATPCPTLSFSLPSLFPLDENGSMCGLASPHLHAGFSLSLTYSSLILPLSSETHVDFNNSQFSSLSFSFSTSSVSLALPYFFLISSLLFPPSLSILTHLPPTTRTSVSLINRLDR